MRNILRELDEIKLAKFDRIPNVTESKAIEKLYWLKKTYFFGIQKPTGGSNCSNIVLIFPPKL